MVSLEVSGNDAYTPRDALNIRIFSVWTMAAAACFITATILIGERIIDRSALAWSLVAVTIVLALLAVRSYLIFLRAADELLRRIQLEGLALGFGAGAVFMLCYRLLERLGAPKLDSNDPFFVMLIFWALGQYIGMRRYSAGEAQ